MTPLTLAADVVARLTARGLSVTLEHPGCVVIADEDDSGGYWWFGTANGYWDADLQSADGTIVGQLRTDPPVYAEESDPDTIVAGIMGALYPTRCACGRRRDR
jgi:hypothetical protein